MIGAFANTLFSSWSHFWYIIYALAVKIFLHKETIISSSPISTFWLLVHIKTWLDTVALDFVMVCKQRKHACLKMPCKPPQRTQFYVELYSPMYSRGSKGLRENEKEEVNKTKMCAQVF